MGTRHGIQPAAQAIGFTADLAQALGTVVVPAQGTIDEVGGDVLKQLSLTGVRMRVAQALQATGVDRLVKATADRILAFPASSEVA